MNHAYAMAYVTLFSLVPSLAAVFGVLYLFVPLFGKNLEILDHIKNLILKHLATGSGEEAIKQLDFLLTNTDFGKIGASGFAGMVITLALLLRQIELALNRIFEVETSRPIFYRFIYFWTILTFGTFLLALAVGTLASSQIAEPYLEVSMSLKIIREFVYNASLVSFFVLLYRVVPNRVIPWKHACIGGVMGALFFAQSLRFFSFYIKYFTKFAVIYGALSALPTFLFWLYVVWFITLLGAAITRRSMEGVESEHDSQPGGFDRIISPLWTLCGVYQSFQTGSGLGISKRELCHKTGLSTANCEYSINLLEKASLIIAHSIHDPGNDRIEKYFPSLPAEQVTLEQLRTLCFGQKSEWLPDEFSSKLDLLPVSHDILDALLQGRPIPLANFFSEWNSSPSGESH